MLYSMPTLFPVGRNDTTIDAVESEVVSHILSVTVGSGLDFQDLEHNITVVLRLTAKNVRENYY